MTRRTELYLVTEWLMSEDWESDVTICWWDVGDGIGNHMFFQWLQKGFGNFNSFRKKFSLC